MWRIRLWPGITLAELLMLCAMNVEAERIARERVWRGGI